MKHYYSIMVHLFVLCFFTVFDANAQREFQYTQFTYGPQLYNPSMVGINGTSEVTFLNRQQWVGIDGAPQTTFLSVGIPEIGKNLAAGLSVFDDKIGPSVETNFAADFSYKVRISERFLLNMGLKSSLSILNVDFTKLSAYDPNDYALSYNVSKVTPNFGVGFTLYDEGKFFSVSIPKILETSHFNSNKDSEIFLAKEKIHIYVSAGSIYYIKPYIKFYPTFLLSSVRGASLKADVNCNLTFYDKFSLGIGYRIGASTSSFASFKLGDNITIGYGFDLQTNRLTKYNSGTHEFLIRYTFKRPTLSF